MALEEEKLIRLREQYSKQAIALAMEGQWREAVAVNKNIVENFPRDVEAYNRLGRAYMELGEYTQAREAYNQTLELDPYNAIAKKNIQRLSYLKGAVRSQNEFDRVEPHHFIEEIGKAAVVDLYALAPIEILAGMVAGDKVYLKADGSSLRAENSRGEYLGQVAPRHALRLVKLMAGGNKYTAAVVSSAADMMTIIIREVYQAPGQAGQLSFPSKGVEAVRSSVSERMFRPEPEHEEEMEDESGYTIIGGEEIEVLPEESTDSNDDIVSDED
ncbi:tetratricopeptide repeat protein [Chloroflexota bacterium]